MNETSDDKTFPPHMPKLEFDEFSILYTSHLKIKTLTLLSPSRLLLFIPSFFFMGFCANDFENALTFEQYRNPCLLLTLSGWWNGDYEAKQSATSIFIAR
jgi:hypothetical protein